MAPPINPGTCREAELACHNNIDWFIEPDQSSYDHHNLNMKSALLVFIAAVHCDLIYEAMKMRTGNWKSWDKNRVQIVGGGILEKKMLDNSNANVAQVETLQQHESRGSEISQYPIHILIVTTYSRNAML